MNSKISYVNDIIDKFSKFYEKDDDEEYENIFNRINIYFTSIINEIKLSYYEKSKNIIQREKYNVHRIKVSIFKFQMLYYILGIGGKIICNG